jgi:hypothetical protein
VIEIHSLNPMVDFGLLCLQAKFFFYLYIDGYTYILVGKRNLRRGFGKILGEN